MDDYDAGYLYECRFVDVEAQKEHTGGKGARFVIHYVLIR